MSTEIQIQEHRTRLYKHANRPVPLQNIRLNITEQNPYHRVIRGNTYNLRTTSSGIVRLSNHQQQQQQQPQYQPLFFEQRQQHLISTPQRQLNFASCHINQSLPTKLVSKRQHVRNMRRTRISSPNEERFFHQSYNRKSIPIQTDDTEIIELRPEVDAEVQTDQAADSSFVQFGGHYREASSQPQGIDKSTQVFPEDPEIFIFDKDVQEILEKLVGTTLVQCMGEVLEEEEISSITRQNKHHKVKTSVLLNDRLVNL